MTRAPGVSSPDTHCRRVPVPPLLRRHLPPEYVTSTEPFADPAPTTPIPMGVCPDCEAGRHEWRGLGAKRVNDRVWFHRYVCACDGCGRCGAAQIRLVVEDPRSPASSVGSSRRAA